MCRWETVSTFILYASFYNEIILERQREDNDYL